VIVLSVHINVHLWLKPHVKMLNTPTPAKS
jgi:hypothetical protein